jgi:hypothetical protein
VRKVLPVEVLTILMLLCSVFAAYAMMVCFALFWMGGLVVQNRMSARFLRPVSRLKDILMFKRSSLHVFAMTQVNTDNVSMGDRICPVVLTAPNG